MNFSIGRVSERCHLRLTKQSLSVLFLFLVRACRKEWPYVATCPDSSLVLELHPRRLEAFEDLLRPAGQCWAVDDIAQVYIMSCGHLCNQHRLPSTSYIYLLTLVVFIAMVLQCSASLQEVYLQILVDTA